MVLKRQSAELVEDATDFVTNRRLGMSKSVDYCALMIELALTLSRARRSLMVKRAEKIVVLE